MGSCVGLVMIFVGIGFVYSGFTATSGPGGTLVLFGLGLGGIGAVLFLAGFGGRRSTGTPDNGGGGGGGGGGRGGGGNNGPDGYPNNWCIPGVCIAHRDDRPLTGFVPNPYTIEQHETDQGSVPEWQPEREPQSQPASQPATPWGIPAPEWPQPERSIPVEIPKPRWKER